MAETARAVDMIINSVHREWYQGQELSPADHRALHSAARSLSRPKHYPARVHMPLTEG